MKTGMQFLQEWYAERCDGRWEHGYGVTIETLDNPGWSVEIDLIATPLANAAFTLINVRKEEKDWMRCWVEASKFKIGCGPFNLEAALEVFRDWALRESS